ncbi:MAG: hypothetical protein LUH14_01535 [Clostridiaceae bacterium]|nr:hypothetical protein [Clostridiaceae bacterium]
MNKKEVDARALQLLASEKEYTKNEMKVLYASLLSKDQIDRVYYRYRYLLGQRKAARTVQISSDSVKKQSLRKK